MAVQLLLVKFMRSPVVCLALHQVLADLAVQTLWAGGTGHVCWAFGKLGSCAASDCGF